MLTPDQLVPFVAAIAKYDEWHIKAIKKGVTLKKDIALFNISSPFWKSGNSDYNFDKSGQVIASFNSLNIKKHELTLTFDKFIKRSSLNRGYQQNTLHFTHKQSMSIKNALTKENIEKFMVEVEKQNKISSEFN